MVIYLTGIRNLAPAGLTMKIKGKHRKGARMESFATASPVYEFGKVSGVVDNKGGYLRNKTYRDDGNKAKRVLEIAKQRKSVMSSHGYVNGDINKNINQLLRNILLFRGIGFTQMERDVKIAGRPVTYNVNVVLNVKNKDGLIGADYNTELQPGETCSYVNRLKVYSITVKKTFRNRRPDYGVISNDIDKMWSETDELGILFDSKTCIPIKDWYMLSEQIFE